MDIWKLVYGFTTNRAFKNYRDLILNCTMLEFMLLRGQIKADMTLGYRLKYSSKMRRKK